MAAIVDIIAVDLYMGFFGKYLGWISSVPQWFWALLALAVVLTMNPIPVKAFGVMEFCFALVKVMALVGVQIVDCCFVVFGTPLDGHEVGFSLLSDNGGLLPYGLLPVLVLMQGVVFSYASIELLGTVAGETPNPEKVMPKAISTVIICIAVFYVGSLVLLYSAYSAGESPLVTFFGSIGVHSMDVVMNLVVLTAALSSLNAGLYSTGRIMRSMSLSGSAPKFAGRMNKAGVPYGGIVITAVVTVFGVVLNAVVPAKAFEIVLNFAAIGIIASWAMIVLCQMALVKSAKRGEQDRPGFRMPLAPISGWVALGFLALVLVMMAFDNPIGTWTIASLLVIIPMIIGGWYLCRGRIGEIAEARLSSEQQVGQR